MTKDDRKCPRCDRRIITEEEYLRLWGERSEERERFEQFKNRVALLFNFILPGLGSFVKTGSITLLLLCLPLYALGWALFAWGIVRGMTMAPIIIVFPLAVLAVSIWLTYREKQ